MLSNSNFEQKERLLLWPVSIWQKLKKVDENYVFKIAARVENPPSPVFNMHELGAAVTARVMLGVQLVLGCAFLETTRGYHVRCYIPVGACFPSPNSSFLRSSPVGPELGKRGKFPFGNPVGNDKWVWTLSPHPLWENYFFNKVKKMVNSIYMKKIV